MKMQPNKTLDVITLGQTFVDFYGQQIGSSLKDMIFFKKFVGGIPGTVAIGVARLGLKSGLISTVGEDELGQFVLDTLNSEQVDITQVKKQKNLTPLCLTGIENKSLFPRIFYHLDQVEAPEGSCLNSVAYAQLLLVECDGNPAFQDFTKKAIHFARENQTKVLLVLTDYSQEKEIFFKEIYPLCDILIGTEATFQAYTQTHDTLLAVKQLKNQSQATLVLKRESGECFIFDKLPEKWENHLSSEKYSVENPYGLEGLSAFVSGFLKGWLQNAENTSQLASLCTSLVQTRQENSIALPSEKELSLYLSSPSQGQLIKTTHFSHVHYASTHHSLSRQIYAFSFGYHSQWLKMGELYHIDEAAISRAKLLIAQGLNSAQTTNSYSSVISDDHFSQDIVELFPGFQTLIRSVEAANEVPLQFRSDPDITRTLLQWPRHHIVKVAIAYHPDDRYILRGQQEATLNLLYRSCRTTEHELLIEIAPPANSLITASTLAHIMNRFYEIGIYPDWWQIQPPRDQRSWDGITRTIDENDPYCRGILVVGQQTTFEQLKMMFINASKQKYCKGFVIGRTIINHPLEQWFAQKITDSTLTEMVAVNFQKAVSLWNEVVGSMHKTKEKEEAV